MQLLEEGDLLLQGLDLALQPDTCQCSVIDILQGHSTRSMGHFFFFFGRQHKVASNING